MWCTAARTLSKLQLHAKMKSINRGHLNPYSRQPRLEQPGLSKEGRIVLRLISWTTKVIYLFLNGSFSQCISVSKVVDLDVLDEVAILLVGFANDSFAGFSRGRPDDRRARDR